MTSYPSESELQAMVAETPSLLPGVDAPTAVAREFPCHFGRVDVVAVELGGRITICECKTARNQELRRKVVGQVFAYAAALSGLSWEEFAQQFQRATQTELVETARALAEAAGEDEWDEEAFRTGVSTCLERGGFRLVLAVEAIPEELREIIGFLNLHSASSLEVLALELSYRKDGDVEVLVPQTWGEESAKQKQGGRKGDPLDREALLALIGEGKPAAIAARMLLDWAEHEPDLRVRYTITSAVIETTSPRRSLVWVTKHGALHVELGVLHEHGESWSDESAARLVEGLKKIGVELDPTRQSPKAPLDALAEQETFHHFVELMEFPRSALAGG